MPLSVAPPGGVLTEPHWRQGPGVALSYVLSLVSWWETAHGSGNLMGHWSPRLQLTAPLTCTLQYSRWMLSVYPWALMDHILLRGRKQE